MSIPQDIAIVEPQSTASTGGMSNGSPEPAQHEADPRHCVLLRAGGLLSVLDMDQV
jgi:hypothetical protein